MDPRIISLEMQKGNEMIKEKKKKKGRNNILRKRAPFQIHLILPTDLEQKKVLSMFNCTTVKEKQEGLKSEIFAHHGN